MTPGVAPPKLLPALTGNASSKWGEAMPTVKRDGDNVTIEMSFTEYRDLTEAITTTGNASWRHAFCTDNPLVQYARQCNARAAWEWSNGIGIPPLNDGEVKTFELEPFKYLSGFVGALDEGKAEHGKS